jgi:diadenosine tetraphosphate (Ap4A) HIT family hydrolase
MLDKIVYEDKFFQVVSPQYPLNCREDGGHLVLLKKESVKDRSEMDWQEAIDFIRISMMVGKAMYDVLGVERLNYEDLGNWGVDKPTGSTMHLHFFGRAKEQTHQIRGCHMKIYPEGHKIYKGHLKPFTDEEIDLLKKEIDIISQEDKYVKMAETAGV